MASRSRGCVVPAVLAVTLTAGAAYGYHQYATRWATIQSWLAAKPGLTRVDLSRPGEVAISLPAHTEVHHHGYSIYLDPGAETAPESAPRGEVLVTDGVGEPAVIRLADALAAGPRAGGRFLCSTLPSSDAGHTVTVRVEEGSAGLAGAESVVYARYAICELVALPALMWGLVAGVPAAVLWGVVLWRATRCYRAGPGPAEPGAAPGAGR